MGKSAIEWTEETWNPVVGCSAVSTGCKRCYAEKTHKTRLSGRGVYPEFKPWTHNNALDIVTLAPERLDQPLRWTRPRMIFVNSMSDLFHERLTGLPSEQAETEEEVKRDLERFRAKEGEPPRPRYIAEVFAVMSLATEHTFQVLTKRPTAMALLLGSANFWLDVNVARMKRRRVVLPGGMSDYAAGRLTLPNVWLGTSIENDAVVERADWLKRTPAAIRFISAEPLLGSIPDLDLHERPRPVELPEGEGIDTALERDRLRQKAGMIPGIDWLIVGGESGDGHRPIEADWVRQLRDAATEAGTAFFFKQWGGHTSKAGGRELDGRTWDEMPTTTDREASVPASL